jgi:hypothetical protein
MAKFLITYHGGGEMPADQAQREQMMSAFMTWAASVGDSMIDPGAPLGPAKLVSGDGVSDDKEGLVGGYTLLTADSLDDAVEKVRNHPFVSRGGTLRIAESVAP